MDTPTYMARSTDVPAGHPWTTLFLYDRYLTGLAGYYRLTGQMRRLLKKSRVQFVCLHHVFEDEEEPFRRLLNALSREHQLISYSDAVQRVWEGRISEPCIAFSFDDGLKNCMRAAQVLDEFGASACFFLCPPMVGESDYGRIRQFCEQRLGMPAAEFLTWNDVDALLKAGHEIGGHTRTHANLGQTSEEQTRAEIAGSLQDLGIRTGNVKHFAVPFGRLHHFSPTAARIVFEAGYQSCASVERGCHVAGCPDPRQLLIRRTTITARRPISHTLALLATDSQKATVAGNAWPADWQVS